ncbi:MAG: anti-sigma factor [Caulobacteraceae bacterium]|nr:anti-sigma factor [Caulobacteraceae bacterium]
MRIDDEILAAYVDGELDPADKAQVDAAARTDAALARRIQAQRRLRETLAGAYGGVIGEPTPDRLMQAVRSGAPRAPAEVVDLGAARAKRASREAARPRGRRWAQWGALAACAVLAVGVGLRVWRGGPSGQPVETAMVSGPPGAMVAQGPLAEALDNQLASAGPGVDPVRIGVSFRSGDGRDCRTFQVTTSEGFSGLACRQDGAWRVRATEAETVAQAQSAYRQAGSETPPAILAAVNGLIAGQPFNAGQEAAAKAAGWK